MSKPRKKVTEDQFLRRIDRTLDKKVKNGGPTLDELTRAVRIKLRRIEETRIPAESAPLPDFDFHAADAKSGVHQW